jgi:endo-1,4-beta-mannosidase
MGDDQLRQHWRAAFLCELAGVAPPGPHGEPPLHRPVLLEEFGASSDFVSDENVGHYYRQLLHTSLLAGATGWVAWNNTDFDDLADQDPYRHHAFELHFGLTDATGVPKPSLLEMAAFAEVLERVDFARCRRTPSRTALVVSSYLEGAHPITDPTEGQYVFDAVEQAHLAAREADLPPAFVRERDGLDDGYRLYLVPSTKQLTAPSWLRLQELAESGATVWVSYGPGDSDFQRGPWWTNTTELFGVRNALVYGLNDPIEDDDVELTFVAPLGDIAAGERLRFTAAGSANSRAFLPVEVLDGETVAVDGRGRPAVVRKRHGDGQAVLCTFPLEHLAAAQGRVNPEPTWRIYRALAEEAGATGPVSVPDPAVLVDGLEHEDGSRLVWLVSEHPDEVKAEPRIPEGTSLQALDGSPASLPVQLPPYGVAVLRLVTTTDQPAQLQPAQPQEDR